ncbi:hypothetical protein VTJ49DRAFT_1573 [Mycothermus thermophilus]|uniref:NB-ARC domain-containing protein n=1 Tax=Humicola insolens TaxID=85995 RepID=A0ABR3VP70_HUMIN
MYWCDASALPPNHIECPPTLSSRQCGQASASTGLARGNYGEKFSDTGLWKENQMQDMDIDAAALDQLRQRIPRTVKQVEYEAFFEAARSCTTNTDALDLLKEMQANPKYDRGIHKFFDRVNRLLQPLRLFKRALDTLCQVEPIFTIFWGSVKVLMEIANEVAQVPSVVSKGIDQLIGYFPAYEQYQKVLRRPEGLSLREPLTNIYVEYLTFCILARRLAKPGFESLWATVKAVFELDNPFSQCLSSFENHSKQVLEIAAPLTLSAVLVAANVSINLADTNDELGAFKNMVLSIINATDANSILTAVTPCHMVPGLLSEAFVGRGPEIEWLRDTLQPEQDERLGMRVGIHGMTGMGKTQLMLKYEAEYRSCYSTQLFLSAPSKKNFQDSLQDVLEALDLPQRDKPDLSAKILGLHNWLLQSQNWLLLIDNVDNESVDLILQLLAPGAPGHVIVTSQEPPTNEAVEIFIKHAGIAADAENKSVATEIVQALGFLPHAIEQAASYTRVNWLSPEAFLDRYQETPDEILEWDKDYDEKLLVFDSLEKWHPDALAILKAFSLLETESIPVFDEWQRADWTPGFSNVLLSDIFSDRVRRERAIAKLCDLSLVRRMSDQRLLWMHDLTRTTARRLIPPWDMKAWVNEILKVVYHMMPVKESTAEDRGWVDTCLPFAMGLLRKVELEFQTDEYACLLALCAVCNLRHDAWGLSQEQFEAALPEYAKYLGLEHPRTLTLMHNHAWAVRNRGNVKTGEAIFRRTWELRSKAVGPGAPETLSALNDLAETIERAGRLKEAEAMFKALWEGYRESTGEGSQETLAAGHNYALCFHNQGRLREAAEVYRDVLSRSAKERVPRDEGTLKTMANYAATLDQDGRSDEASDMYHRALVGYTEILGVNHRLTLRLRVNIASLLKQQGRFKDAEFELLQCVEKAMSLWEIAGVETMAYLYDMGEVWQAKGDLCKARDAYKTVVDAVKGEMIGHPLVPRWIDSWSTAEREMGHLTLALEKSKLAYELFEGQLGWYDPYTLVAANDYAEALQALGEYPQAWGLYTRCLGSFSSLLGKDHPHYAMTLNNMGRCCWAMEDKTPAEAETYFLQAHEVLQARVGASHFCTLTVALNIARTKAADGNIEEGLALAEETRDALAAVIGPNHPLVSAAHLVLGILTASRGDDSSLLAAADHIRAAVSAARTIQYISGANYYLGIALLVLLLRRTTNTGSSSELAWLLEQLQTPVASALEPFWIPGVGNFTAMQLAQFNPPKALDFGAYIPLFTGETVKLRWGRKTCWREVDNTMLNC